MKYKVNKCCHQLQCSSRINIRSFMFIIYTNDHEEHLDDNELSLYADGNLIFIKLISTGRYVKLEGGSGHGDRVAPYQLIVWLH